MLGEQLQIDGDILFAQKRNHLSQSGVVREVRAAGSRLPVNVPLKLRLANTSQRSIHELHGRTKDFSMTGCGLILDKPPFIGDIYRFDGIKENDPLLSGLLGRCIRCSLIDEEVFEAGFRFLTPLPQEMFPDGLV
ncbi:MAG TPA: hypothetical protein DDZ51_22835 [Planctomycetaceae bacterium]|nr:hypothetical protein [Planctomycetaceae bacterium]